MIVSNIVAGFGKTLPVNPPTIISRLLLIAANAELKTAEILMLLAVYNRFSVINKCLM